MGKSNQLGSSSIELQSAALSLALEKTNSPSKLSDEEAAKWASLLVHSFSEQKILHSLGFKANEPAQGIGNRNLRPTNGLESSTLVLSDDAVTQSQLADTGGVNEAVPSRLILSLDSETLGRVQLVVDREEGGVRVLVGSDPQARSRLSEGKHAITEALSAAGVRVGALRFVTLNEVGTVLAQDLVSKKPRQESIKKDDLKEQEKGSKTKRHNINLVG